MRGFLSGEDPGIARFRRVMRHIPHGPNCKLCAAPFEGPGGAVLGRLGYARYPGNPAICGSCIKSLNKLGVYGAEIEVSLMFADIRGSTGIGEALTPTDFREFLDNFYRLSAKAILDNDGIVDKFVGDGAVALFIPGFAGPDHAADGIAAARDLLRAAAAGEPPLPIGVGVHTGVSFVGTIGEGDALDFTALGDTVNTASRVTASAGAGELLVTHAAAEAAGLDTSSLERRTLELRGRSETVGTYVLRD